MVKEMDAVVCNHCGGLMDTNQVTTKHCWLCGAEIHFECGSIKLTFRIGNLRVTRNPPACPGPRDH